MAAPLRVAAWQAPLATCYDNRCLSAIQEQVRHCESHSVDVLCCPEGIVGGLADYPGFEAAAAMIAGGDDLAAVARQLASPVTVILGFSEADVEGRLFNSAVVVSNGEVLGLYRKQRPALRHSVYRAGTDAPVFTANGVTFGVLICLDSTFPELAATLVTNGAQMLLVPTNNGLPPARGGAERIDDARHGDVRCALAHGVPVVRSDVAGAWLDLVSHGASGIVDGAGHLLAEGRPLSAGLMIANVEV